MKDGDGAAQWADYPGRLELCISVLASHLFIFTRVRGLDGMLIPWSVLYLKPKLSYCR